jgi:hypothetical protein
MTYVRKQSSNTPPADAVKGAAAELRPPAVVPSPACAPCRTPSPTEEGGIVHGPVMPIVARPAEKEREPACTSRCGSRSHGGSTPNRAASTHPQGMDMTEQNNSYQMVEGLSNYFETTLHLRPGESADIQVAVHPALLAPPACGFPSPDPMETSHV